MGLQLSSVLGPMSPQTLDSVSVSAHTPGSVSWLAGSDSGHTGAGGGGLYTCTPGDHCTLPVLCTVYTHWVAPSFPPRLILASVITGLQCGKLQNFVRIFIMIDLSNYELKERIKRFNGSLCIVCKVSCVVVCVFCVNMQSHPRPRKWSEVWFIYYLWSEIKKIFVMLG